MARKNKKMRIASLNILCIYVRKYKWNITKDNTKIGKKCVAIIRTHDSNYEQRQKKNDKRQVEVDLDL